MRIKFGSVYIAIIEFTTDLPQNLRRIQYRAKQEIQNT